jgi:hypothetical protein
MLPAESDPLPSGRRNGFELADGEIQSGIVVQELDQLRTKPELCMAFYRHLQGIVIG